MRRLAAVSHSVWIGMLAGCPVAHAQENHLPEIQVQGPRDASIGSADSASEGAVERESYQSRPKLRPGDIVEAVPGVDKSRIESIAPRLLFDRLPEDR